MISDRMATKKRPSASPHIILSGAKIVFLLYTTKQKLEKVPKGTVLFGKCYCKRKSLNYVFAKKNRPLWASGA
jgi:hypothetical protein